MYGMTLEMIELQSLPCRHPRQIIAANTEPTVLLEETHLHDEFSLLLPPPALPTSVHSTALRLNLRQPLQHLQYLRLP